MRKDLIKRNFMNASGEETLMACFDSTEMALRTLRASIKNENPNFNEKEVESELARIIRMQWKEEDKFARRFYAGG